ASPMPSSIGLACFVGGFFMGRSSTPRSAAPAINPEPLPAAAPDQKKAEPAKPAPEAPKAQFVIAGSVKFKEGGREKADIGARVLAFPNKREPIKKIVSQGLRVGDAGGELPGLEQLERNGGAMATVEADGSFKLALKADGPHWVLILSRGAALGRPATLQADEKTLEKYFADIPGLLGERDFWFGSRSATPADGPPGRPLNIVLPQ
ncbi:MAG TPA: hypothetical protein VNC50_00430, partial [Planctomycetia bacterium]|nr:hypothetical protein [Planctomycetia bacterium]